MRKLTPEELQLPRFRKSKKVAIDSEFVKHLRKTNPNLVRGESLTEISKLLEMFKKELCEKVKDNRFGVDIPNGLGRMFVGACEKNHSVKPNYSNTENKRNESDRFLAKIFYTTFENNHTFTNRGVWGFEAGRDFSRGVSKAFKENHLKYVQVDNKNKINQKLRDYYSKIKVNNRNKLKLLSYNEFEL